MNDIRSQAPKIFNEEIRALHGNNSRLGFLMLKNASLQREVDQFTIELADTIATMTLQIIK